jgi:hypothetical protein
MVEPRAALVDMADDGVRFVGYDPRFQQADPEFIATPAEEGEVRILRPPREYLVADDQDAGAG